MTGHYQLFLPLRVIQPDLLRWLVSHLCQRWQVSCLGQRWLAFCLSPVQRHQLLEPQVGQAYVDAATHSAELGVLRALVALGGEGKT